MDVQMPDGTTIQGVPDGITKSQLLAKYQKFNTPQSSGNGGFIDRVSNDFAKRDANLAQASDLAGQNKFVGGEPGLVYNAIGQTLQKGLSDVPGEAIASLPQPIKDAGKFVYSSVASDPVVGGPVRGAAWLLDQAGQGYNKFKQNNPTAGLYLDSTLGFGNALASALPVKGESLPSQVVGAGQDLLKQAPGIVASGLEKVPALDNALGKTIRPVATDLKAASQTNYAAAENLGGTISPQFTNDLIDHASNFTHKDPMAAAIAGENPIAGIAKNLEEFRDQPMTLDRATAVDQALTERLDDAKFTDKNGVLNTYGRQLLGIKNKLREGLASAADKGLVEGGPEGINAYKIAVKDWAAQSQISEVQRIVDRASYMDNPATALKTGFRAIAINPGRLSKFSPAVQTAIKSAARDGDLANIMRTELGSRLISATAGSMAGMAGGPLGSIAGAVGGFAMSRSARNMAEKMQMGRVNNVLDEIAAQSSLPTKKIPLSEIIRSPSTETKKILQLQESTKLLAAPDRPYVSNSSGVSRPMTNEEWEASQSAQQRAANLGLSPDIYRIVSKGEIRNRMGPIWDKLNATDQQKIADQINELWSQNKKIPLMEIINKSRQDVRDLAVIKGEKTGVMFDALSNAQQMKPMSISQKMKENAKK